MLSLGGGTLVDLKGSYTVGARRVSVEKASTSPLSRRGATCSYNKLGGSSREVAISVTFGLSTLT